MIAGGTHASKRSVSLFITSDGGMINNGWRIPGVCDVAAVVARDHKVMWVTTQGQVWKAELLCGTGGRVPVWMQRSPYTVPVLVRHAFGNAPVRSVAMGRSHSVFLLFDGRVLAQGNNIGGCLGRDRSITVVPLPEPVPGADVLGAAMSVSAGEHSTGIILTSGKVYVMGMNSWGQLGLGRKGGNGDHGNMQAHSSLTCLDFPSPVLQLSMSFHGVAVLRNGDAYTWGRNDNFQCGTGDTSVSYTPLLVRGPWSSRGVSSFACGNAHTVFLDMTGKVFMAGLSTHDGSTNETFTSVLGLPPTIVAVLSFDTDFGRRDRDVYICKDGGVYEGGVLAGGFSDVPVQHVPLFSGRIKPLSPGPIRPGARVLASLEPAVPQSMTLQTSGVNLAPRAIYPANMLAFTMGLHHRLGAGSKCRVLENDVLLKIMRQDEASNECEHRRNGTAL